MFTSKFLLLVSILFVLGLVPIGINDQKLFAQTLNDNNNSNQSVGDTNGTSNGNVTTSLVGEKVQVSIVPGSSMFTDTAYDPNPIEIGVGETIVWTNDDRAFHTVTSGEAGAEDAGQVFDSGFTGASAMTTKGKTFEHTFDIAGEYPYYCILHPGMIGTVIVT
jgi:plastocyanin